MIEAYELPRWLVFERSREPQQRRAGFLPRPPYAAFHTYGEAMAYIVLRWGLSWDAVDPSPDTETYP